ncbi:hypothetical protein [Methylobacterium sp. CM6246]
MPVDREQVLPGDALDQLACKLLAEARVPHSQKPLGRPIGDLGDDVGTNLLAWLLDAYDDALGEDGDDRAGINKSPAGAAMACRSTISDPADTRCVPCSA